MKLGRRSENKALPKYSLTGDLLSYMRCGLQYRFHNGSALPPSRPVQFWFGDFIHGMLETAFRIWRENPALGFPWPMNISNPREAYEGVRARNDLGLIGETIEAILRAQGKSPRSAEVRDNGYKRAYCAVNEIGPILFPMIKSAEEKLIGTRSVDEPIDATERRATLYELHGIVDVLTEVTLSEANESNFLKRLIVDKLGAQTGSFEIIVDYKGARRPPLDSPYWAQGDWQVQTYAWLRSQQRNSRKVLAGVLVYVNELLPSSEDIENLKSEIASGRADVIPPIGSADDYQIRLSGPGSATPALSLEYRLNRAFRVIPITAASQDFSLTQFDSTVSEIEECVANEERSGTIASNWKANGNVDSCETCDFRFFCPDPYPRGRHTIVKAPDAP